MRSSFQKELPTSANAQDFRKEGNIVEADPSKLPMQKAIQLADLPESMQESFKPLLDWQQTLLMSASAAMPQVGTGAVAVATGGMYRPVNGTEMTQKPDGTWTPVGRDENGKITGHGAMEKGDALAQAGAIAWSLASVVVGQAHLMAIAAELTDINLKLDALKSKIDYEKIAAVKSAMLGWREIDFSSPNADVLIHQARNDVRKACLNLFQAIKDEARALPETGKLGFWEGFGAKKSQRFEQAKHHFTYLLRLLPAYMTGMMFLAATDGCIRKGDEPTGSRFLKELDEFLPLIQNKVRLVPMIAGLDEAPDTIVENLVRGRERAHQEFMRLTDEIASGRAILLPLTSCES